MLGDDDGETRTRLVERPGGGFLLQTPRLRLEVIDGPDRGVDATPDRSVVRIGTHPSCELCLQDPTVSRIHCELRPTERGVRVVDAGSSNGTFVEGIRVLHAEVPAGTLLNLGETTLRIGTVADPVRVPLSEHDRFGALLGRSVRMREVFAVLERVAPTDTTVLLEGESGTGKELAAEALHAHSRRSDGPLVVFDCGAVTRDLVESSLFGHVRGAFTGAIADHTGMFEEADGGTLLLDEIGELPLELQPKLLRALEKREIRRVGGSRAKSVDVRIVAATNRALEAEVNAGRFRQDLYFRLAVVKVTLPPLRARPDDLSVLIEHFVQQMSPPGKAPRVLSARTVAALAQRPWPGNVRELRNAVERALSLGGPGALASGGESLGGLAPPPASVSGLTYAEALDRAIEVFERQFLEEVLGRSGGNVSKAARLAGCNRKLIQRMMRKFDRGRVEDPDEG